MKYFDSYHLPKTLDEALDLLARYDGRARVIAGGTDLLLDLSGEEKQGERPHYAALIDVTLLSGADEIRLEEGWIVVGCAVTHTQLVACGLVQTRGTALMEACALIGGPQVRNVATLAGNVAHGLPAADGTIALMALGAQARVVRRTGAAEATGHTAGEWRPLGSLFLGPGQSAVDSTRELIAALRFLPTDQGEGSAFARIMRPQGVALPILGLAARLRLRGDIVEAVSIAAGPVAPVPFRAARTEEFLCGRPLNDETVQAAREVLLSEVNLRTSAHRATREYRGELLPGLLEQTLRKAAERARVSTASREREVSA